MIRLTSPAAFSVTVMAIALPFCYEQTLKKGLTFRQKLIPTRPPRSSSQVEALPVHLVARAHGPQVVDRTDDLVDDEINLLLRVEPSQAEAEAPFGQLLTDAQRPDHVTRLRLRGRAGRAGTDGHVLHRDH